MYDLTPELVRVLGGAARYVAHRDQQSTAAAAETLCKHPQMLSDVALELAALCEALKNPDAKTRRREELQS